MTTTNNSIPTKSTAADSFPMARRKWTIIVGVALGVGAATLAASAVQSESAPAHEVDPATVYSELTSITDWARTQGLSGLSPASLRPVTD
jgi:hypothetical protein